MKQSTDRESMLDGLIFVKCSEKLINLKNEHENSKCYNRSGPIEAELRDDVKKLRKVNDNLD